jgi:hypothetical protein
MATGLYAIEQSSKVILIATTLKKETITMSYDRVYLCPTGDPNTWSERRQMAKQGRSEGFDAEADHLREKGDFVVLVAGANLMFGELYLFEQPEDANRFYEVDFASRESIVDGKSMGFQEISLYRSGKCVATKSQPAPTDQGAAVSLEQSNKEETSAGKAVESADSDLLEFE